MAPTGIQPKSPHFDEEEILTPELSRKSISSNSSSEIYENCMDSSDEDDYFSLESQSDACLYCPNCGCECCEIYDKEGKLQKFREINQKCEKYVKLLSKFSSNQLLYYLIS